jgi:hypothetical protein
MATRFHDKTRRLGALLAIATALMALVAHPALGKDRPAASYYKAQDLQRMSDSWAARGGVLTNVPASSYYLPQQIETMSQSWAARAGLLPSDTKVVTTGRDRFDWADFGMGAAAMLGLLLLGAGLVAAGTHYSRLHARARPAA